MEKNIPSFPAPAKRAQTWGITNYTKTNGRLGNDIVLCFVSNLPSIPVGKSELIPNTKSIVKHSYTFQMLDKVFIVLLRKKVLVLYVVGYTSEISS